jgi:uncharacterized OB-fold protein
MPERVPVQEGIFSWPSDRPKLLGGRCQECGVYNFPFQSGCPACGGTAIENVELADRGTLWTFTSQNYPPPVPPFIGAVGDAFEPYAAGYVELPGKIRVASRLTENDPAKLRIGMEMELRIVPLAVDEHGNDVMTFAFAPAGS